MKNKRFLVHQKNSEDTKHYDSTIITNQIDVRKLYKTCMGVFSTAHPYKHPLPLFVLLNINHTPYKTNVNNILQMFTIYKGRSLFFCNQANQRFHMNDPCYRTNTTNLPNNNY